MRLSICTLFLLGFGCASDRLVWTHPDEAVDTGQMARVIVPNEIELVSIDGQAVQSLTFLRFRERRDLLLNPGPHRLVVRLRPAYDLADEDHRVLVSEARTLEFEAEAEGRYRIHYRLPGGGRPGDPAAGEPEIWIKQIADDD